MLQAPYDKYTDVSEKIYTIMLYILGWLFLFYMSDLTISTFHKKKKKLMKISAAIHSQ